FRHSTNPPVMAKLFRPVVVLISTVPLPSAEIMAAWLLSSSNHPLTPGRRTKVTSPVNSFFSGVIISRIIVVFKSPLGDLGVIYSLPQSIFLPSQSHLR